MLLKQKVNYTSPTCLDINNFHGNYQSAKGSLKQIMTYMTKEDKEPYLFNLDLETIMAEKKKSIASEIAIKIKEGSTLEDIDNDFPGYVLSNKRKISEYIEWQENIKRAKVTVTPHHLCINNDIFDVGTRREHRQKQLYIWGPAGIGKTSIINRMLDAGLRGFHLPYNGHWEDWFDNSYDFAFADEFHGQVKITELNKFLEGAVMHLPCRFQNKMKCKNILTIILSNVSPEEQYMTVPNSIRTAFLDRLIVLHLEAHPSVTVLPMTVPQTSPIGTPETEMAELSPPVSQTLQ